MKMENPNSNNNGNNNDSANTGSPKSKNGDNCSSRSFFGTLNHPEKYLDVPADATPQEIAQTALDILLDGKDDERAAMVSYCLGAKEKTPHLHYGLFSKKSLRLKTVRALMPHADNQVAKGTRAQIDSYVRKTGDHAEKGEEVVSVVSWGEFKGAEANQSVYDQMYDYIWKLHLTPGQVCRMEPKMYRHINTLRQMYADSQAANLPPVKKVHTVYHVGAPGSGKSYVQVQLKESLPDNSVYVVTDYVHGFDLYQNQPTIFLDELKDQVRFADLLMWLDVYPNQIACRYANQYMTWTSVHIASVIPPEELIRHLPGTNSESAVSWGELKRRIHEVCFHWTYKGHFYAASIPMSNYIEGLWTTKNVEGFLPCAVLAAAGCDDIATTNLVLGICTDEWLAKRVDINTTTWTEEADATWMRIVDSYYMIDIGRHLTEQITEALFQGSYAMTASLLTLQLIRTAANRREIIPLTGGLTAIQDGFKDRHCKLNCTEAALLLKAFDQWSESFQGVSLKEQEEACLSMLDGIAEVAGSEPETDVLAMFFSDRVQSSDQPRWVSALIDLMCEYRGLFEDSESIPFNSPFLFTLTADAGSGTPTGEAISHAE